MKLLKNCFLKILILFLIKCLFTGCCFEYNNKNNENYKKNISINLKCDFFSFIIENPTCEVYYIGNVSKVSCFCIILEDNIRFWNIENAYINPSIIFPFTKNSEGWKLLKSKNDKKLSFWDKDKEIGDFINSLPIETALVQLTDQWYEESSHSLDNGLSLYEKFTIVQTLYPNFNANNEIIVFYHCITSPSNLKFDKDRGVFYNPEFRIAERDLYIINWEDTEYVIKGKNNISVIHMSDNSLVGPFSFYWELYCDDIIDFDESLALSLYQKRVESMLPNDSH
ncbi:MAG: hypothetical protein IJ444_09500 [Kiritimatiellae bacterium]|nr:hypothetical protein [Kiritimatiellia bacterium]